MPPRDFSSGAPPVRYPDPDVVVLDPRFRRYKLSNAAIERLWTGGRWLEGPAWHAGARFLVCSDIPNDRQLRWLHDDGHVSVFRAPAGNSNGNTFDREGRLVSCEHLHRRVVRHEHDGSLTVLADRYEGKRLNAPNDVVVHPDGSVWFTDPGYGALLAYEGTVAPLELKEAVYRVDPHTAAVEKVLDTMWKPNGLCFSPDFSRLYVVDTGASHYPEAPRNIMVFDVVDGRRVRGGREFVSMRLGDQDGHSDGIRCDVDGNVWAAAGGGGDGYDGVHVFAPDGVRIGQIRLPEVCSNLCFGGAKRNRLFMTGSQSLYALYVEARGA